MNDLPRWRGTLPGAILLTGAAVLAAWSVARTPLDLRGLPATPFDRADPPLGDVFRFLSAAAPAVPEGASATVVAEPRDATRESSLYGAAVALLGERRVLPAAQWNAFTPSHELEAEYVLVYGPRPASPPGPLIAAPRGGFVFRRSPRP